MDNAEKPKVDKIIFRPLRVDMSQKVKKISDPPPRPMPQKLDTKQVDEWVPETKADFDANELASNVATVGSVLKYILFTTISLSVLAGLGWVAYWVLKQYGGM